MMIKQDILSFLAERRRDLKMPYTALSERSGTSVSTIKRVLAGDQSASLGTVARIAKALGATFELRADSTEAMIHKEAAQKARQLVAIVQGTSALEAQAVGKRTLRQIESTAKIGMMAHPGGKLWAK